MKALLVGVNSSYVHTSLSVRALHAYAEKNGLECSFCEHTVNAEPETVTASLYAENADIYAFSAYIFNIPFIIRVASDLKKAKPQCFIVFGGPEVSFNYEKFLRENPFVDVLLCGEGEEPFCDLLRIYDAKLTAEENKKAFFFAQTKNIAYIYNGNHIFFGNRPPLCVLSSLPFAYDDISAVRDRILYYESSRGCPFRCSYCLSAGDMPVRYAPEEKVFADMKRFLSENVKQVKFTDRTFNSDRRRAQNIWRFLSENDNGVTNFHFEIAAWLLDAETADFLRTVRKGLFQFETGVQTTNPDTMEAINRPVPFKTLKNAVKTLDGGNIHLHTDLIAGLPHESYESFSRSFDDVYSLDAENLQLGFLKLLRGSPLEKAYEDAVFSDHPPYEVISSDKMTYAELVKLKKIAAVLDIYHNSGLCSFLSDEKIRLLTGLTPFMFYERFADFCENTGFFLKPKTLNDTLGSLCAFLSTLLDSETAESLAAFELYRRGRVGAFPEWLRSFPDREGLRSLLNDESRLRRFVPGYICDELFLPTAASLRRRCELVSLVDPFSTSKNRREILFLYKKEVLFFLAD